MPNTRADKTARAPFFNHGKHRPALWRQSPDALVLMPILSLNNPQTAII